MHVSTSKHCHFLLCQRENATRTKITMGVKETFSSDFTLTGDSPTLGGFLVKYFVSAMVVAVSAALLVVIFGSNKRQTAPVSVAVPPVVHTVPPQSPTAPKIVQVAERKHEQRSEAPVFTKIGGADLFEAHSQTYVAALSPENGLTYQPLKLLAVHGTQPKRFTCSLNAWRSESKPCSNVLLKQTGGGVGPQGRLLQAPRV